MKLIIKAQNNTHPFTLDLADYDQHDKRIPKGENIRRAVSICGDPQATIKVIDETESDLHSQQ